MEWAGFNLVDALLLALLLLGAASGWRWGLLVGGLSLLSLIASLLLAWGLHAWPAALLRRQWPGMGLWAVPVAFVLCFVLAQLVLGGIGNRIARALPERAHRHPLNRLLGLGPGLVQGALHAAIMAVLLLTLPLPGAFGAAGAAAQDSRLARALSAPATWLEAALGPLFNPALQHTLRRVSGNPGVDGSIDLPVRVADPQPRPDLEARMLELVNAERAREGLRPLRADPAATAVARAHSRDMFTRGYFSHVSPEGGQLEDRLRQGGVRYLAAGENLAFAPTLQVAHAGLMRSPGHRANILRPQFGRVGIGVLDGGACAGLVVTQNFRD